MRIGTLAGNESLAGRDLVRNLKSKKLQGGPGKLGLAQLAKRADAAQKWLNSIREPFQKALKKLFG